MAGPNEAVVRRFGDELWNKRNRAIIDELVAENWFWHDVPGGMPGNRETLLAIAEHNHGALANTDYVIEQLVEDGDKVAFLWTLRGDHTGNFAGVPPSGKRLTLRGMSIDRIAGGKLTERWDVTDVYGAMQQIGAIPQ